MPWSFLVELLSHSPSFSSETLNFTHSLKVKLLHILKLWWKSILSAICRMENSDYCKVQSVSSVCTGLDQEITVFLCCSIWGVGIYFWASDNWKEIISDVLEIKKDCPFLVFETKICRYFLLRVAGVLGTGLWETRNLITSADWFEVIWKTRPARSRDEVFYILGYSL